jgi:hypothetical protein
MKTPKYFLLIAVAVLLSSCGGMPAPYSGTYRFTGPGTFQDFANTRYQCAQETSRRVGGAYVNQYGGSSSTNVIPSCSTFRACLAAKGYYPNPNGNLDASSIIVECN